jgi:hypothetical protein
LADVHAFEGTYGDYVLGKVGKVFPQLMQSVMSEDDSADHGVSHDQ